MWINPIIFAVLIIVVIFAYICLQQMDTFVNSSNNNLQTYLKPIDDRIQTGYQMMNDYRFKMMNNQLKIDRSKGVKSICSLCNKSMRTKNMLDFMSKCGYKKFKN
jgi:hypothetical protein